MLDALPISPELLLLLVATLLYLSDAAQLLYTNEVLFLHRSRGVWRAYLPDGYPTIARRFLLIPKPLQPGSALLRVTWPRGQRAQASEPAGIGARVADVLKRLAPIRWLSALLLPQIFLALPLIYMYWGDGPEVIVALLLIYLQAIVLVSLFVSRCRALGLGWGKVALIAFESLICIPYAINVYRKATLHALPKEHDILELDRALLSETELAAFRQALVEKIDRELEWNPDSPDAGQRVEFRKRLGEPVRS